MYDIEISEEESEKYLTSHGTNQSKRDYCKYLDRNARQQGQYTYLICTKPPKPIICLNIIYRVIS